MPRGQHKAWHPGIQQGELHDPERFIDPWPRGAVLKTSEQRRGHELHETEQVYRGGYQVVHGRSIADFWAVKGQPLNGKGNKAMKAWGSNRAG
jgi:hypothetical protein